MKLTIGELKKLIDRCDDDFTVEIVVKKYETDNRPSYHKSNAEFADIGYSDKVFVLLAEWESH